MIFVDEYKILIYTDGARLRYFFNTLIIINNILIFYFFYTYV